MRYLHTMVRVTDLETSLAFYTHVMGMEEIRRIENEKGRFTLVFLAASEDRNAVVSTKAPCIELTYNWDPETYTGGRNFGHLAYEVDDVYAFCDNAQKHGVIINRPPRDGHMAFIRSPDDISFEILQKGEALAPQEPWVSMENSGNW